MEIERIVEIENPRLLSDPFGFVKMVGELAQTSLNGNSEKFRRDLLEDFEEVSQKYLRAPAGFDQGFQHTGYPYGTGMRIELTKHTYSNPHDLTFIFNINQNKRLTFVQILDTHRLGGNPITNTIKINLLANKRVEIKKINRGK